MLLCSREERVWGREQEEMGVEKVDTETVPGLCLVRGF